MRKNWKKGVALVIAAFTTVTAIPMIHGNGVLMAAEQPGEVTRGVIDKLEQLPQYNRPENLSAERGTAERPFMVLEIVPYEELAEFGYLIGGCEPVAVEEMYGRDALSTINSLGDAGITMEVPCYFFSDEPEGNPDMYDRSVVVEQGTFQGYYEVVEDGSGDFLCVTDTVPDTEQPPENTEQPPENTEQPPENTEQPPENTEQPPESTEQPPENTEQPPENTEQPPESTEQLPENMEQSTEAASDVQVSNNVRLIKMTGNSQAAESTGNPQSKMTIIRKEGGNLIWHTLRPDEEEYNKTDLFDAEGQTLEKIGDRFYTYRVCSGDDKAIQVNYYTYDNYDLFLKDTLELSDEEADNFSVVVKTITPEELNGKPEWIDYADLVYLSPKSHVGALPEIWRKYNRLGKKTTADTAQIQEGFADEKDISWEAALRLYEKITAEKDFAAVIIDDGIYNRVPQKKTVTVDVPDWNLNSSGLTYQTEASCNNTYKLCVMLLCMDSTLFHSLYLSGEEPVIQDGIHTKQSGDAANYWNVTTFFPVPPKEEQKPNSYAYGIWKECPDGSNVPDMWKKYGMYPEITTLKYWTKNHIYTYNGDSSLAMNYAKDSSVGTNGDYFTAFDKYMSDRGEAGKQNTSDAVRYILGNYEKTDIPKQKETLRILDIEPCVALSKTDGQGNDYVQEGKIYSEPKWVLKESYIRMLFPSFTGKIEITHQTTAEFNGKIEDLNSSYDMIYLGTDTGAYTLGKKSVQLYYGTPSATWAELNVPDWNDGRMDGKIYFHTGDKMFSAERTDNGRTASVKFLYDAETGRKVDDTELRFNGNDISSLKKAELQEFVDAGCPVVAASYLYYLEPALIDDTSHIYNFVKENKAENGGNVYRASQTGAFAETFLVQKEDVVFMELPALYNGETDGTVISNPNYLPTDSGKAYLWFRFETKTDGYCYKIYLDQDGNSKFSDDEAVVTSQAAVGENTYKYRLSPSLVGLLQWKIEVYQTDNPGERSMRMGCSAVQNATGIKKQIRVLQIMPKDGYYEGSLNLETSELFKKYYRDLADYEIDVDTVTWNTYESYFRNSNFKYDMSKEIGNGNPVNEAEVPAELSHYNMIIVGFGDTYGAVDLSNRSGAVDYLKYYIAQGKSVLFTHDVTSLYNLDPDIFGYSANSLLRDVMGMNRYRAVSSVLSESERNTLVAYQNLEGKAYDTTTGTAKHGFSYYALKRLGWSAGNSTVNSQNHCRVPYRYMITNTEGNPVCAKNEATRKTGFNDNNDLTTGAERLNEGQITQYPYKIDEDLPIALTHGQWYQLNVEDPDVTVWYTLSDDHYCAGWDGQDQYGRGTALTYGVSPKDASNNYYIYSKGNVFYSGVGHSTVNGDMEAKLFINTMIAAYRASYEPPAVEITNGDAYMNGAANYELDILQEYDSGKTGDSLENEQIAESFSGDDGVTVTFMTVDFNPVSTKLEGWIYMDGGDYIDQIVRLSDGAVLTADAGHKFTGLTNGAEYSLVYKKSELNSHRVIKFELKNDRVPAKGVTTLTMSAQPLFELD